MSNDQTPTADPRDWIHMDEAPRDGTLIEVFVPQKHGLPGFISDCSWHPDAGFCVDELREPTAWRPKP